MKKLFHLASDIQTEFQKKKWRFCFIGGIALQRWGEPRLTLDVDISLLTGFGNEKYFVDSLCRRFVSRIENADEFALRNRVLLLKSKENIPIDIVLAGLPFEERVIDRATDFSFLESAKLRTCSAEDLIVYKAFADRKRDWADIEGILLRQKNALDMQYIKEQLQPLAEIKKSPHILHQLHEMTSALKKNE
jgi:hypothetical protein